MELIIMAIKKYYIILLFILIKDRIKIKKFK